MDRNLRMAERIGSTPVRYPFSFVFAGDSGAWADPTADAIFSELVRQAGELRPEPVFFANLGDFAGPGTRERHEHYLGLVEPLPIPDVCVVGNHDLDDERGPEAWAAVHGPTDYTLAYGHTRFVAIDGAPGEVGEVQVASPNGTAGPREAALEFLDRALADAAEPHRVVLTHAPPHLGGHYAPHPEWGFTEREAEFLAILRRHGVQLVCCAHGLAFDHHVHDGIHFVMSGGGGTGLCSHLRGICSEGSGRPEDRGALFHAVQITLAESGEIHGAVLQAFAGGRPRITFA
jgi:Calcineurin-like phosphoesterase